MSVRQCLLIAGMVAAASTGAPRTASADWLLTPFVGWNFGGSADVSGNGGQVFANKFKHKVDYGASIAAMGGGVFGLEMDFGYSPNFFATTTGSGFRFTSKSNATTLTGNVIVAAPVGRGRRGWRGRQSDGIRPYAVAGIGLVRTKVQDADQFFDVTTKNDLGLDVGGGVMGFFNHNVGLRGDVRYFRGFRGSTSTSTGLALSNFEFWRGSFGMTFRF